MFPEEQKYHMLFLDIDYGGIVAVLESSGDCKIIF